jgi:hypothetical protein
MFSFSPEDISIKGIFDFNQGVMKVLTVRQSDIKSIQFQYAIVKEAKEHGVEIVFAPPNMFSDDTNGHSSHRYNKYESVSFTFSNLPLKTRSKISNSYVLSTGNAIPPMEQLKILFKELEILESGVVGLDEPSIKQ